MLNDEFKALDSKALLKLLQCASCFTQFRNKIDDKAIKSCRVEELTVGKCIHRLLAKNISYVGQEAPVQKKKKSSSSQQAEIAENAPKKSKLNELVTAYYKPSSSVPGDLSAAVPSAASAFVSSPPSAAVPSTSSAAVSSTVSTPVPSAPSAAASRTAFAAGSALISTSSTVALTDLSANTSITSEYSEPMESAKSSDLDFEFLLEENGIVFTHQSEYSTEQKFWNSAGTELFQLMVQNNKSKKFVLVPSLRTCPSNAHLTNSLQILFAKGNKPSCADVQDCVRRYGRFEVLLSTYPDYYMYIQPDGLCFWRCLYSYSLRALAGLGEHPKDVIRRDRRLLTAPDERLKFLDWMRRIDQGLSMLDKNDMNEAFSLGKFKTDDVNSCRGLIARVIAFIEDWFSSTETRSRAFKMPKTIPSNDALNPEPLMMWGELRYIEYIALIKDPSIYFPCQMFKVLDDDKWSRLQATTVCPTGCVEGACATFSMWEIEEILQMPNFAVIDSAHYYPGPSCNVGDRATREAWVHSPQESLNLAAQNLHKILASAVVPAPPKFLGCTENDRLEVKIAKAKAKLATMQEVLKGLEERKRQLDAIN